MQKHGVKTETGRIEGQLQVMGDRVQLRQVLLNLMTNAMEAMASAPGPRILSVSGEVVDGSVLISVADTGPGIQGKDIELVFKPLLTTKSEGMGLGLAISRSIIEVHGGRLWARPNSPRGAIFQFSLPAETATAAASDLPSAAA